MGDQGSAGVAQQAGDDVAFETGVGVEVHGRRPVPDLRRGRVAQTLRQTAVAARCAELRSRGRHGVSISMGWPTDAAYSDATVRTSERLYASSSGRVSSWIFSRSTRTGVSP